jgi:hypothetical protein
VSHGPVSGPVVYHDDEIGRSGLRGDRLETRIEKALPVPVDDDDRGA